MYDATLKDWITAGIDSVVSSSSPGWSGNRVSGCVPVRYEAYAKIMHPIYEDPKFANSDETWDEWLRAHPGLVPPSSAEARRVRWRDLASLYDLVFHAELTTNSFTRRMLNGSWPRKFNGPAQGAIDPDHALRLASLLRQSWTGTCYFTFFPTAFVDLTDVFSLRGTLDEMPEVLDQCAWATPAYWWPEDRSWCVCTDYDLEFTLVGAERGLADRILRDELLETIEVRPEHRVDMFADSINA